MISIYLSPPLSPNAILGFPDWASLQRSLFCSPHPPSRNITFPVYNHLCRYDRIEQSRTCEAPEDKRVIDLLFRCEEPCEAPEKGIKDCKGGEVSGGLVLVVGYDLRELGAEREWQCYRLKKGD